VKVGHYQASNCREPD